MLESFNGHLFTHVTGAISEYEGAHYLASALLAGKAIMYVWEQFPGKTNEEKVGLLLKANLIKQSLKEQFLKAEKKSAKTITARMIFPRFRNLRRHTRDLVADACNLSMILMRFNGSVKTS